MARKRPKVNLAPKVEPRSGDMEKLFSTAEDAEQAAGMQLLAIRLDAIEPDPDQPRRTSSDEGLQDLSESIRQDGVIQPIEVTEIDPGRYKIVHGERRWRAAQMAGLETIPAVVRRRDYDTLTRFVRQLVENIQREDLNDVDRAAGLLHLRELMQEELDAQLEEEGGSGKPHSTSISWAKVGRRLGYSRQRIHQLIQLLKLPDPIKEAVRNGELSERDTRVYQGLTPPQQLALFRLLRDESLSQKELKRAARQWKESPQKPVDEVLREIRSGHGAGQPRPGRQLDRPATRRKRRKLTQNFNRVHWARDHLARIQLYPDMSAEERAELLHLIGQLQADVETLVETLESELDAD